jgi:tripartite ATP-independent transporter DctP family solute receptor
MRHRRLTIPLVVLVAMVVALLIAAPPAVAGEKPTILRLAHVVPATSTKNLANLKFSELVQGRTKNQVQVHVFPGSQLGNEMDLAQGAQMGTLDLFWGDVAVYASHVKEFNVFNAPLVFKDTTHWGAVVKGPIFDGLADQLLKKAGLRVLARHWMGERYVLTRSKPVATPDDIKGLKIRVPDIPMYTSSFKALGAIPTPINYSEVYLSLQQGVVDGMENPVGLIRAMKFYEVAKYLTLVPWNNAVNVLVVNESVFQRLKPEQQKILLDAGKESEPYLEDLMTREQEECLKLFESKGVKLIQPKDLSPWLAAVKDFPQKYGDMWGRPALYTEIQNYKY